MNKRLKVLLCIAVMIAVLVAAGCAIYKAIRPYDPDDFVGLTHEKIVEQYGEFDVVRSYHAQTGGYGACGYTVEPKRVGFLGTEPPEYFMVYFDENGIAYKCAYETGGWGG